MEAFFTLEGCRELAFSSVRNVVGVQLKEVEEVAAELGWTAKLEPDASSAGPDEGPMRTRMWLRKS